MSRHTPVWHWSHSVSTHVPPLRRPQAHVLALWSSGSALTLSCGMTTVVVRLAHLLGQREYTVRQRVREWCYDAADKRGAHRPAVEGGACFAPLLRWMVSWWAGDERRVALALDASTLSDRCPVVAISVLSRGCASPVAWKLVLAQTKGAWAPHWKALLGQLAASVPAGWTILVRANRGLYAPWVYEASVRLG